LEASVTRTQLRILALSALTTQLGIASALGVIGCAATPDSSSDLASAGADGEDTEADTESLAQSFVGTSGSSGSSLGLQSADELNPKLGGQGLEVQGIVSNPAGGFYQPPGCLVENSDSATKTNTYTFSDCTGPFGLLHLTGVVTAVWSVASGDTLDVTLSASNFQVNKATLSSWNANATITANGSSRDMVWSASLSGTTGSGRAFSRTNNKNISWTVGEPCLAISGTSQGTITGLDLRTVITSYSRCEGSCPAAGSEIQVTDVSNGDSVAVKYLGGAEAQFTGVNGTVTDIPLLCGL
jgi:hypothetical protein